VYIHNKIVGIKSVRIGDVVMQVYPAENPELVPEVQGPFYEGAQVGISFILSNIFNNNIYVGYT
jgi:hypothetical protein